MLRVCSALDMLRSWDPRFGHCGPVFLGVSAIILHEDRITSDLLAGHCISGAEAVPALKDMLNCE